MQVSRKLIENVGELKKALNEISVYDLDVYTSMELYYKIANKLNEVIKELMRFEGLVSDEVIKQNEKLVYLLGEGLNSEVVKKINQMVADGTMDTIINHNVFNSLNNKIEDYKEELSSQIKEKVNKSSMNFVNAKDFGVKADGVTDDIDALQSASDYCYENNFKLILPPGIIKITKPWVIYGHSDEKRNIETIIEGAGRDVTKIYKTTNEGLSTGEYKDIDSAIIIANDYVKENKTITSIWSSQSIAFKIQLRSFTIEAPTSQAVANGIYSYGFYMCHFYNLAIRNILTAMRTTRYNCFNTFERLEIDKTQNGFEFLSESVSCTTLRFVDVHLNGLNGVGYHILGHFKCDNCSIDGGNLVCFKGKNCKAVLFNCHTEAPNCKGLIQLYTQILNSTKPNVKSDMKCYNCTFEIPMVHSVPMYKLENTSFLHLINSESKNHERAEFPTNKTNATLYEASAKSRILFTNCDIDSDTFITYTPFIESGIDKHVLFSPNRLNTNVNTYVAYRANFVTDETQTLFKWHKNTTDRTFDFLVAMKETTTQVGVKHGVIFKEGVDLSNFSRLYVRGNLNFNGDNNGNNTFEASVLIYDYLIEHNSISNTALSYIKKDAFFYDDKNHEFYIDITSLQGIHYIALEFANIQNNKIYEVALLR